MIPNIAFARLIFIGGLSLLLARCGAPEETSSSLKAPPTVANPVVETSAAAFPELPYHTPYLEDGQRRLLSRTALADELRDALDHALADAGAIPTTASAFLRAKIEARDVEGCSTLWGPGESYHLACVNGLSFITAVRMTNGPDLIAEGSMRVPFVNLERVEMRRRLRWAVKEVVTSMLADGGGQIFETPYF